MADQALATRIRQQRKERGLTLDALAEASGIGRRTLINYENGTTSPPLDAAANLAQVLGVTLDWLAGSKTDTLPDLVVILDGRTYESWEVKTGTARAADVYVEFRQALAYRDALEEGQLAEAGPPPRNRRRGDRRRRKPPTA